MSNSSANNDSERGRQLSQMMEELGIDQCSSAFGGGGGGCGYDEAHSRACGLVAAGSGGSGLLQKDTDLNTNERRFLLSVEMGDMTTVRQYVENAEALSVNVNCVDSLGRSAVLIAIEFEHIELLEMLLGFGFLELGDALLHAIQEENVVAVEMLLHAQAEKQQKKQQSAAPGPTGAVPSSSFTPDITPIILAAHIDNYEILKILLDRGDRVPKPHELRCACDECVLAQKEDSLRHSKSRINAYKALASPSLICLSSKDPILTAFELSWEMKRLGRLENEFKSEYEQLAVKCQEYATALLEQTRSSAELAIVLNQDIGQSGHKVNEKTLEEGEEERMTLSRLKLAIKYKQKKFVAHPHCQQLLAALWYDGLPGFRRKHLILQMGMIATFAGIFPVLAFMYLLAPHSNMGQKMRKPFIKFICHSASYLLFLGFLVLAAIRVEDLLFDTMELKMKERGAGPSAVELIIVTYVMGFVWQEIKQLWNEGAKAYVTDMWNLLDFATNALYIATITLRGVAWYRVRQDGNLANIHRQYWDAYDPTLISECLFATANIFSMLKLVYIFTVNPHLGPLQISLGRMLSDILKFLFVVVLVLSSFACGFNQLYWFYAYERNKYCKDVKLGFGITGSDLEKYQYCVTRGRTFSNLFEITQTLYWSTYGLIDLSNTDLEYQHSFTEFVGKLMYGVFSAITFVVLLNMLIAMMNCSYESIATQADTEWKFARSKLWISYFEEGGTLPVPFNIIPSPKSFYYIATWMKNRLCSCSKQHQRSKWQSIRKVVKRVNEREARYQTVMRDLVKRYLMVRQRLDERQGVTEDDLNEIKGDISAFRFELLEILRTNGMKTPAYTQHRATKLRRRGSKRSMQSRRLGKFDAISEEGATSSAGAFSSCSSAASLSDQQHPIGGGFASSNRLPIRSFSQPGGFEDCATRPELTLNAAQLNTFGGGGASQHQPDSSELSAAPATMKKHPSASCSGGGGPVGKKVSFGGEESVEEDGVFDDGSSPKKRLGRTPPANPTNATAEASSLERRSDLV